jgi:hypothetical protein
MPARSSSMPRQHLRNGGVRVRRPPERPGLFRQALGVSLAAVTLLAVWLIVMFAAGVMARLLFEAARLGWESWSW